VSEFAYRLEDLRQQMERADEAALIISSDANFRWLHLRPSRDLLLVDRDGSYNLGWDDIGVALRRLPPCQIGVDPDTTAAQLLRLQRISTDAQVHVDWQSTRSLAKCRAIKDDIELSHIRQATQIAHRALTDAAELISPGVSEIEIANRLNLKMYEFGAEGIAFEPSVGSGPRGALPWAGSSLRRVRDGESIVIDCGAMVNEYRSDITRTYFAGGKPIDDTIRRMEEIVRAAMDVIIRAAEPGMPCRVLHQLAMESLRQSGWKRPMNHALGHGVGLQLHERPYVSPASSDVLQAGMVIALEPGAYDQRLGGFRIEDMFVVTIDGVSKLADSDHGTSSMDGTSDDLVTRVGAADEPRY
jgi:Xaa-Pro aminopeptidase